MDLRKKCILYVRVSTEEQLKGYSIDAQIDEDTIWANQHGYDVIKVFKEEGISAKSLKRPVLQTMMEWGRKHIGEFDAVVFWKWERISRGTEEDYVVLGKFFSACGVHPLSVTECNEDSPEGELLRHMIKGMNLYELRKISQRTKLGLNYIAKSGRLPQCAPIGYMNFTNPDESKSILINPKTAPFVKQAFEMYATGNYSIEKIEDFLYREGVRNQRGGKYQKVEHMLKNLFYIGKFVWKGQLYEGTHEPLISRELFDRVQMRFGHKKPKTHNIVFPYTNMIKCAHCGNHNLSAELKRGAHNSGEYIYYKCRCGVKAVRQEVLETEFLRMLDDLYIPPQEIEALKDGARAILEQIKDFENQQESPEEITKQIEKINTRIKKAYADKLDGNTPIGMSEKEFHNLIMEWARDKDILVNRLNERMEKSKILYDKLGLVMAFLNKMPEFFRLATPEMKRQIIQTCCRTLSYDGKNLYIEMFPLFNEMKKRKNLIYGAADGMISELPKVFKILDSSESDEVLFSIKRLLAA